MKREQILINVRRFSVRYSSDKDCAFAGLKKFFTSSEMLLNEFLQSDITQKSRLVQNITDIIPVADE